MAQALGRVPVSWKEGNLCYSNGLTLDLAKKMLEAGEKEAKQQGVPMVIAIADSGGHIFALHRMDNAVLLSIQVSMDKAMTAVYGKKPSGQWADSFGEGKLIPLFFHERWITFSGGFPLVRDGKLLGGIGVSGGRIEDMYVARAAMKAGNFNLEEIDAEINQFDKSKKE